MMKTPILSKYIDEATGGFWFIFGESEGGVDVSDRNGDVFSGIPKHLADKVILVREKFMLDLYKILGM